MPDKYTAIKGMNDLFPPDSEQWDRFEAIVRETMALYAYRSVRTPIVERTALFSRGLGQATDVVEKEMYSFEDRADQRGLADHLSLRPEGTAGVVRAVIEHNALYEGGKRLYYMGPMFRRERPQRGRYRQFHQVGAEALGLAGPQVDAELILIPAHLWRALGIKNWRLELGCLGQPPERKAHREALINYFEAHASALDEDARRRLHVNPLRILDTKNPAMQELVEGAPRLLDYLGAESNQHFEAVQGILRSCAVEYRINPRLVRGLDYYNLTVFEFITDSLGAQGTFCGGGRYDYLFEELGGKPTPAVGWAIGVERVLELIKEEGLAQQLSPPDAYAIVLDAAHLPRVMAIIESLRSAGAAVQLHAGAEPTPGSIKSQFKKADASGAAYALIFGADEMEKGQVSVKALRDSKGEQTNFDASDAPSLAAHIKKRP